jgi:glutathione peroxidase
MIRSILFFMLFSFFGKPQPLDAQTKSIYDFTVSSLDGGKINFADFKGKKILIVNTASKCGYTPQYEELEALHKQYKGKLVIVGFPANNFLFQEPGSNETIAEFCKKNYGVSFPMASKISVKGKDMHPLYVYLTQKQYNGYSDNSVKWNFQKYLLNEKGQLIGVFEPGVKPLSEELVGKIR